MLSHNSTYSRQKKTFFRKTYKLRDSVTLNATPGDKSRKVPLKGTKLRNYTELPLKKVDADNNYFGINAWKPAVSKKFD